MWGRGKVKPEKQQPLPQGIQRFHIGKGLGCVRNRVSGALCGLLLVGMIAAAGCAFAQTETQTQSGSSTQTPTAQTPSTQTPTTGQEPSAPAPAEEKKDNGNPVTQVEDKTKEAVGMTKDAATAGLIKARDWESGLIAGVYVGRNRKLVTLTAQQRKEIYLRQTLTTPGAYGKRAFGALIDQARGTPSQWDDGWGGYFERWASREGQFVTANTIAAIGNAKLGYEVGMTSVSAGDLVRGRSTQSCGIF